MKGTNLMTYKSLLSKPESSSGKTLNELNLMDAYLFETVTNNPVFAEKMAKMMRTGMCLYCLTRLFTNGKIRNDVMSL